MLGMKIVSVNSKHYHPLPSGNPGVNLQNLANPGHPGQIFLSNAQPLDFPGSSYFNTFYTFPPLTRSQSLEYLQIRMENTYLLIENV